MLPKLTQLRTKLNMVELDDGGKLYFSYGTMVAFKISADYPLTVHKNDWGNTTGQHLNSLSDDLKRRVDSSRFEAIWKAGFLDDDRVLHLVENVLAHPKDAVPLNMLEDFIKENGDAS